MQETFSELRQFVIEGLPQLVIPVVILVIGFVVALIASAMVRRALHKTRLDERLSARMLGSERGAAVNTERWAGRIVFYVILALTAVAVLQSARLMAATEPLNAMLASILAFVPNLIGAAGIALAAWLVASLARGVLARSLARWDVDRRVQKEIQGQPTGVSPQAAAGAAAEPTVSSAVAEAAYWLVWLLFTPALLGALTLDGLLVPVREMLAESLGYVPNIAAAAVVLVVGWFVARIIQRVVTNSLAGIGIDGLSERSGVKGMLGELTLSSLVGYVVYILILIPVAIGSLNALQLESITAPASTMLESFFAAIPAIFGAALVLAVSYIAARLLYGVVHKLLNGVGFDNVLSKVGVTQEQLGSRTPSRLVAGLTMIAVIYFAAIEAARLLGFEAFALLATEFSMVAGHILLGLVVFGFGLFLSQLAAEAIRTSSLGQARVLSMTARVSILTLAGAMALRQMGIADEIIVLAFGLVLGAVAIAGALAFGLGGRDAASKTIEEIRVRLHEASAGPTGGGNGGGARRPVPTSPDGDPVLATSGAAVVSTAPAPTTPAKDAPPPLPPPVPTA